MIEIPVPVVKFKSRFFGGVKCKKLPGTNIPLCDYLLVKYNGYFIPLFALLFRKPQLYNEIDKRLVISSFSNSVVLFNKLLETRNDYELKWIGDKTLGVYESVIKAMIGMELSDVDKLLLLKSGIVYDMINESDDSTDFCCRWRKGIIENMPALSDGSSTMKQRKLYNVNYFKNQNLVCDVDIKSVLSRTGLPVFSFPLNEYTLGGLTVSVIFNKMYVMNGDMEVIKTAQLNRANINREVISHLKQVTPEQMKNIADYPSLLGFAYDPAHKSFHMLMTDTQTVKNILWKTKWDNDWYDTFSRERVLYLVKHGNIYYMEVPEKKMGYMGIETEKGYLPLSNARMYYSAIQPIIMSYHNRAKYFLKHDKYKYLIDKFYDIASKDVAVYGWFSTKFFDDFIN